MSGVARRRLGCLCNCHEAWWAEHGNRRHATCSECIAALREERRHLRAIERQIRADMRAGRDYRRQA